ncbi:MAG: hypothetical protein IJI67_02100 [Clostridia bacterium]|nr:hypothetical protein [Clostridia bacterium]
MKATKQSKKVPKKVKRIQSYKDVIQEGFLALFGDDIKMQEQNLFELFALKSDENAHLFLDLHTGKLYLHNGVQYLAVDYSELPDFLKNGGKGSGKYKHLSEKNWRDLADKQQVQEIFEQHYPSAVERIYPTGVTPPDFEAYYIKTASGVNEKSVYLRSVGPDDWRVFFAKTYTGALPMETYTCSEYMLRDLLTGKDRRSKTGDLDCCDRLLGIDEVQYLSAFMPNVHEAKRPKALACAEDESGALVTAYYWKGGKSIACADEDYVSGLFAALEEIARCSVLLEFPDQDEEPAPELPAMEEAGSEAAEEFAAESEERQESAEETVENEEELSAEAPELEAIEEPAAQAEETQPETVAEPTEDAEPEAAEGIVEEAAKAQEPVAEEKPAKKEKRGLFGRRKKHKKEASVEEAAEPEFETATESVETEAVEEVIAETAQLETIEEAAAETAEPQVEIPAQVEEPAAEEAEPETTEESAEAEPVEKPAAETIEPEVEIAAEVEAFEAEEAFIAEEPEQVSAEEVVAEGVEPAAVQEPVQAVETLTEEKPAKKEKRGLFGRRKKRKKELPVKDAEVPAVVEEPEAVEAPAVEKAEQEMTAETIEEVPEPETTEEPAEEIVEAEPVEESVEESAEPEAETAAVPEEIEVFAAQEAAPETAEETGEEAEAQTIEEVAQEVIEADTAEMAAAQTAALDAAEETASQAEAAEATVVQEAEQETVEEFAAEPEPKEEPAEEVVEAEREEAPAGEAVAEPEVETSAEVEEPEVVEEPVSEAAEAAQPETAETPARTTAKAPEHKPLRLKRQKKAAKSAKEGGARAADYDLPQRISAYAAAGKKKAIKKEILAVLPDCPLIVPISAANIESDKVVYISKQAGVLCGDKIVPFVLMADKVPLLPGEENSEQRQGVMVKTVVNRGKTYIPVFADFKTAVRIFGTSEKFGVFTLKNILSHISHNESVQGITINPGEVNLKLTKEDFEENE